MNQSIHPGSSQKQYRTSCILLYGNSSQNSINSVRAYRKSLILSISARAASNKFCSDALVRGLASCEREKRDYKSNDRNKNRMKKLTMKERHQTRANEAHGEIMCAIRVELGRTKRSTSLTSETASALIMCKSLFCACNIPSRTEHI